MNMHLFRSAVAAALIGVTASAAAHTVWLEPVPDAPARFQVKFGGHAGKLESYDPDKLKTVDAVDAHGKPLSVARQVEDGAVVLSIDGEPALIAMHFNNGIYSRPPTGPSVNLPMREVEGATQATYAVKYHKTIVEWVPLVTETLGQPFEVVPLDATAPRAGEPMRVRVLQDGEPAVGVRLGHGEEGSDGDPVTDADGVASFIPTAGFNRLWAGKRIPVSDDPDYTELSYEYSLGFDAR